MRGAGGFTLLEVLVVAVIMAIVSAAALISVGVVGDDREMEREVERLTALIDLAGEEALLQGREIGMLVEPQAYRFFVFDALTNRWLAVEGDDLLRPRDLPEGGRFELSVEGRKVVLDEHVRKDDAEEDFAPQIMILSSGQMTPFEIDLERDLEDFRFTIIGEANGETEVEKHEL
ncbi:MAG: type II secretion system minor pseudopilin GspH [Gammaproteobacteria bacterium]